MQTRWLKTISLFLLVYARGAARHVAAASGSQDSKRGAAVTYQLPTDGPLPRAYRVTLAITDTKNPHWLISTFVAGATRTVTAQNGGKFTASWDGLDDNFMPVPPGTYGVKGIYMPARQWQVDGEYHSVTPQFVTGAAAWMPSPEQWNKPEPFGGDPVGAPVGDVAVGPNGVAVFYYQYLENGTNNPLIDLKKPSGYDQFLRAFGSGGAGGGTSTATDGETVWSFSTDGGPKYVYRADGQPFGTGTANRNNVYRPTGWVTAMAAGRDAATHKSFVYCAQRGKIIEPSPRNFVESDQEFVDAVTIHDGATGAVLATIPLRRPQGLALHDSKLYALHESADGVATVSILPLVAGLPHGNWQPLFALRNLKPFDLEVDSQGRIYISDPTSNHVFQLNAEGKVLRTFGRLAAQVPGTYDPLTLIAPGKLATWKDAAGQDRLLIVEQGGPNRVSEWSADGKLSREFMSLQTKANDGYAIDPEHPQHVYIAGQQGWLTRFKVDYEKRAWTVDAVWPHVGDDPLAPGFDHPKFVRVDGHEYLACSRSYNIYRHAGDQWLLAAAIVHEEQKGGVRQYFLWHDTNGDGRVQEAEYRNNPMTLPGAVLRYHGEQWLDDLSLVAMNQAGPDVWRLAPQSFDARGNPIFKAWQKLLTDPVFTARTEGKADATHGGNELAETYSSDWSMINGSLRDGFYVSARGGPSFSANEGGQIKISRFAPDGKGAYRLLWRTGRKALQGVAQPGEIYATMHLNPPINGLLSVIDQSRCGVLLYTTDGLYVDTIFPDGRRFSPQVAGLYPQPGEFFTGQTFANRDNGKIYFAMGKFTPLLFEAQGWSLRDNPTQPLVNLQKSVTITAAQIAAPPEIALSLRGGAGTAKLARFAPALGGAALDGSLVGWESCEPVRFQADKDQTVEARCLYDADHLYLRWHARLATPFQPKPLQPVERIFSHDRLADTLSFYMQGDVNAKPGGPPTGRAGDARFVFGIFRDGNTLKPVALGLYPTWAGATPGQSQTYATPVGKATFEHVGLVPGVTCHHVLDADGKGFVLVAALPRAAIPQLSTLDSNLHTMVNFEATFSGHNKFWWANSDGSASRETYDEPTEARLYPGSWAPAQFQGLESGVVVRHWLVCGPFGGPGAELFGPDLSGPMPGTNKDYKQAGREFSAAAHYPPDDKEIDFNAAYTGPLIRGYWNDPGTVRWQPATVADLDTRVVLGAAAQVWYGTTWIHAPADMELEFRFQGHPQTYLRFFLNGQSVQDGEIKSQPGPKNEDQRETSKKLTLRQGWNQVMFRGYCVGYPPFRAGLVLTGAPEKLWALSLSATPPTAR